MTTRHLFLLVNVSAEGRVYARNQNEDPASHPPANIASVRSLDMIAVDVWGKFEGE